jgi:hypothetical protein
MSLCKCCEFEAKRSFVIEMTEIHFLFGPPRLGSPWGSSILRHNRHEELFLRGVNLTAILCVTRRLICSKPGVFSGRCLRHHVLILRIRGQLIYLLSPYHEIKFQTLTDCFEELLGIETCKINQTDRYFLLKINYPFHLCDTSVCASNDSACRVFVKEVG